MSHFIESFTLIVGGLLAGMATRWLLTRRGVTRERADGWVAWVQRLVLLLLVPISTGLAVWVAQLRGAQYAALPLWGFLMMAGSAAVAWVAAAVRGGNGGQRAALFATAGFGNLGSVGSLIIFLVLGEGALAYQPLICLLEKPLIYAVGFPIVRGWAQGEQQRLHPKVFLTAWRDPYLIMTLVTTAAALALNLSGVARPAVLSGANNILMPLTTGVLLWTMGMNLRPGHLGGHGRVSLVSGGVRLLLAPALTLGLMVLAPLPSLPARVIVLLAASPPAFLSQVAVQLYGADQDEASAMFLSGMALYALTMPLWLFLTALVFPGG